MSMHKHCMNTELMDTQLAGKKNGESKRWQLSGDGACCREERTLLLKSLLNYHCGLTLASNKAPHSHLLSCPWWDGGENGKNKSEKTHGLSLVGKAKDACENKAKQGIHSLLPIGRRVFSHLQESRAP